MTTATLKPRNGLVGCSICHNSIEQLTRRGYTNVAEGEPCPSCLNFHGRAFVEKFPIGRMAQTVLGPLHEIPSTGNPLLDTAAILEADGWVDGEFVCREGRKCVIGALRVACGLFGSPDAESRSDLSKYTEKQAYKAAQARFDRAVVILAEELKPGGYTPLLGAPKAPWSHSPRAAANKCMHINDDPGIAKKKRRDQLINALRAAGKNWNPRLRVGRI